MVVLPAPVRPTSATVLTWAGLQVDIDENRFLRHVGEAHIA